MLPPDDQPPDANQQADPARVFDIESAAGTSPFADQLCVPQFGILHILILTTITAILLKLQLALQDIPSASQLPEAYRWSIKISQSVWAVVFAAGLVGSGVLIRAKCYTMFSRLQPGHWIVLVTTLQSIVWLVMWPVYRLLESNGTMALWVYSIATTLLSVPIAIAFLYGAKRLRDGRRWKILLGAKALGEAAAAAMAAITVVLAITGRSGDFPYAWFRAINGGSQLWSVLVLMMLLVAVLLDIPRRASRDWLHWLGVATLGLHNLMTIVWWVVSAFILPRV
jgi:hypothetical protein